MVGRVVIPALLTAACGGCVGAGMVEGSPAAIVLGLFGVAINLYSVVQAHRGLVALEVYETLQRRWREP